MVAQELKKEIEALDGWSPIRAASELAVNNAGDTFGPISAENKAEWMECYISTIRSMLCDPSSYDLSAEVIAWFAARGVKG